METREAMERFERAEEATEAREQFARHAAILVAIIAAMLAIAALAVERQSEHILLAQAQSSDAYNELEANSQKKHTDGDTAQMLTILAPSNPAATKAAAALQKAVDTKYSPNEVPLLAKAQDLAAERDSAEQHHTVLQMAEASFQLAIVLASIAIVARATLLLRAAMGLGLIGLFLLVDGFTLWVKLG